MMHAKWHCTPSVNNGVVTLCIYACLFCIAGKTSAGTPIDGGGGGGGGGKAVGDDDCDYDKDCNADTDNSDDDNGDHEWIIIRPQTKFSGYIGVSLSVCRSVCLSVRIKCLLSNSSFFHPIFTKLGQMLYQDDV
ncbi:hypothetical protein DPMN_115084 [Dreissena polymorpha]|uniref:Uncharacterized protein n=1 Tax=Dreissena polymorpha TaxID=45954 RepID=A0A9D4KKM5_DREPO|nr:hypothetical protein DPMN_115084 [Dreissena polymorpha]